MRKLYAGILLVGLLTTVLAAPTASACHVVTDEEYDARVATVSVYYDHGCPHYLVPKVGAGVELGPMFETPIDSDDLAKAIRTKALLA